MTNWKYQTPNNFTYPKFQTTDSTFGARNFRPQIISPAPNCRPQISTLAPPLQKSRSSPWEQHDILRTVLRQKPKVGAHVCSYLQCLKEVTKSSIRCLFCNIVPAILSQNLLLATQTTFWFQISATSKRSVCKCE